VVIFLKKILVEKHFSEGKIIQQEHPGHDVKGLRFWQYGGRRVRLQNRGNQLVAWAAAAAGE
jgi:hypothetical protein